MLMGVAKCQYTYCSRCREDYYYPFTLASGNVSPCVYSQFSMINSIELC